MGKYLQSSQFIGFEVRDRIARVTLNRPDKRNALTPEMISELHDALLEADALVDVNVIILGGAGKDFCAGYDLAGAYAGRKSDSEARGSEAEEAQYRTLGATLDDDCWQL